MANRHIGCRKDVGLDHGQICNEQNTENLQPQVYLAVMAHP